MAGAHISSRATEIGRYGKEGPVKGVVPKECDSAVKHSGYSLRCNVNYECRFFALQRKGSTFFPSLKICVHYVIRCIKIMVRIFVGAMLMSLSSPPSMTITTVFQELLGISHACCALNAGEG